MKTLIKMFTGFIFLVFATSALASLNSFNGTWVNADSNTRGLTKIIINTSDANNIKVRAWGKCHPSDCSWGLKEGVAFAPNVSSNLLSQAGAILSVYEFPHAMTTIMIKPLRGNRLRVETFTEFAAGDNRTDYFSSYIFKRQLRRPTRPIHGPHP